MVPREKLDTYRRDGVTVVRGAVSPMDATALLSEFRAIFRPQLARHGIAGAEAEGADFDEALFALFRADMQCYLAAAKATQLVPMLHALAAAGPVLDLARGFGVTRPLIAVRPVVHILADALQVPGGYHRTPPHQDWRSVQGSLDALVVWLPLVPVDKGFGALEVIPGSHKQGLFGTVRDPFGNVVAPAQIDETAFVPVEAAPGDAVVFSMFTVHRTGIEQRSGIRWAVSLRYNNAAAPDFIARNYPNPFVYRSQDGLLFEGFPAASDVRSAFGDGNT